MSRAAPTQLRLPLQSSHSLCCSHLTHMLDMGHSPSAPVSPWGGAYCWWISGAPLCQYEVLRADWMWCDFICLCLALPVQWWLPHIDKGPLHLSMGSLSPISTEASPSEGAPFRFGSLLLVPSNLSLVLWGSYPLSEKGNCSCSLHTPPFHGLQCSLYWRPTLGIQNPKCMNTWINT